MSSTLDRTAHMEFARTHQRAMLLVHQGAEDYVGARCCLLNGVPSGLELGAVAIEKHLKAMLLFSDPTTNIKGFLHKLSTLAEAVEKQGIADLTSYRPTIARFQAHYRARYPDDRDYSISTSNSLTELAELDAVMIHVLDAMPVPKEIALRSGVYVFAIASSVHGFLTPWEKWLLAHNPVLQAKRPALVEEERRWRDYAYPETS